MVFKVTLPSCLYLGVAVVLSAAQPTHASCIAATLIGAQAAQACCCSPRLFSTGLSYIFTPGCESSDCGTNRTSVTDDLVGSFWALDSGDPRLGPGIDNGSFPALGGWLHPSEPDYPAYIWSSWAADPRIDFCIDASGHPERCMAILLMDEVPDTGTGVFAILTKEPDALGNYDFSQPGDITLTPLPKPRITASVRMHEINSVQLTVAGLAEDDISAGIYMDPECSPPHPIAGYRVFAQERGRDDPAPNDASVDHWVALTDVIPLGEPVTLVAQCGTGDVSEYLAYGLEFDSGFASVYLSGPSTRVECGPNLADPDERPFGRERPRNRERPRDTGRDRSRR